MKPTAKLCRKASRWPPMNDVVFQAYPGMFRGPINIKETAKLLGIKP